MNKFFAFSLLITASCAPVSKPDVASRSINFHDVLPVVQTFSNERPVPSLRSNQEITNDFLDLSFRLESGRSLPTLTRFVGPIKVRAAGEFTTTMLNDLQILITRLRREAKIDISLAKEGEMAQINVEALPKKTLQKTVPKAACFVVPRVSNWEEFQKNRFSKHLDWTTLKSRDKASIFIPSDVAPQEIRDCLHEEIAQALGPLNDLYRLPDSVFNDDNINTVLTGFDMLILKIYYSNYLQNGMSKQEVAARLPQILAKLNPRGERQASLIPSFTSREWIDAMEFALTARSSSSFRQKAAQKAINIGTREGWSGPRAGFALYAYGRLQIGHNPYQALKSFEAAKSVYQSSPDTQIHTAHIAVQQAAFALRSGDAETVYRLTQEAIPIARKHQNAALTATLMIFQSEALSLMGRDKEADKVRLDSLSWARYGYGDDLNVRSRMDEIARLRP